MLYNLKKVKCNLFDEILPQLRERERERERELINKKESS